jgi:uncharacterized protein (DUF2141 family)
LLLALVPTACEGPPDSLVGSPEDPLASTAQAEKPSADRVPGKQAHGRIAVEVQGLRNDTGDCLFALFRSEEGFPKAPLKAARRVAAPIERGQCHVVFEDVEPGMFAVSVLHDEDGDRQVRTGIFGIPREGIGFSRDARGRMGPPKFKDARLSVAAGASVTVVVHMHYY